MARSITLRRAFGGRDCSFKLRWGEIEQLEQACGAGIGAIWQRVATLQFRAADIRETVRLGLQGAGLAEPMATAAVKLVFEEGPLLPHVQLAADILGAALEGAEPEKRPEAETPSSESPATSPPSTA